MDDIEELSGGFPRRGLVEGLVRTSPVGITVVDADGEVTFANEAAEEIWGGEVVESESVAEYDR
jgi:PAS domain-containing protein